MGVTGRRECLFVCLFVCLCVCLSYIIRPFHNAVCCHLSRIFTDSFVVYVHGCFPLFTTAYLVSIPSV